jgi:hypothetical protein
MWEALIKMDRTDKQIKKLKQLAADPVGADAMWTSEQANKIVTQVFSGVFAAAVGKGYCYADAATEAYCAVRELIADATGGDGVEA